jgi:trehalose-6-phosphate synthase
VRVSRRNARKSERYALLKALLFCGLVAFGYTRYKDKFTFLTSSLNEATARFIAEVPIESPVYDQAARAEINRKATVSHEISPRRKPSMVEKIAPRKRQ